MIMNDNKFFRAVLSKTAIDWIVKVGQPVANYQFIGYIFPATHKMNGVCDLNGQWGFYSVAFDKKGNQKPLKEKHVQKWLKKQFHAGFFIFQEESPFPEFEPKIDIPIDMTKVQYFDGKLFDDEQ